MGKESMEASLMEEADVTEKQIEDAAEGVTEEVNGMDASELVEDENSVIQESPIAKEEDESENDKKAIIVKTVKKEKTLKKEKVNKEEKPANKEKSSKKEKPSKKEKSSKKEKPAKKEKNQSENKKVSKLSRTVKKAYVKSKYAVLDKIAQNKAEEEIYLAELAADRAAAGIEEPVVKEITGKFVKIRKFIRYFFSKIDMKMGKLQRKISGAFLIMVVLMVFLGVVSYQKASNAVMSKYEDSALSTVEAMSLYTMSVCNTISSKTLEVANDDNMKLYYGKYWKESAATAFEYFDATKNALSTMKTTISYVYNYYTIAENGNMISSMTVDIPEGIYAQFTTDDAGAIFLADKTLRGKWVGQHPVLDEQLGIREGSYGLSYVKSFIQGNGFIVVDINYGTVDEIMNQLAWGDGSVSAIVTADGREVTHSKYVSEFKESPFLNLNVVKDYFSGELEIEDDTETIEYVRVEGDTYLLVYSPIGTTGMLLCSLIPKTLIVDEVASIRNTTIVLTVFSIIVALLVGSIIATGICREVNNITESLEKVASGNFTIKFRTRRKDEFKELSGGLNDMLDRVRALLKEMQGFGKNVIEASKSVSEGTENILISTTDINRAIEEVAKGVVTQAGETDSSLSKMSILSDSIQVVKENSEQMGNVVQSAIDAVSEGEQMVADLNTKSEATTEITKILVENIAQVQVQSNSIGSIIESINSIAQQTNLLSLNASIEAARAGEHGRGFSVVAEEIRKLADQSMESGKKIKKIVEDIQKTASTTSKSAKDTENNMATQAEVLGKTIAVFKKINSSVIQLVEGFKDIAMYLEQSSEQKDLVMDSVRNISAISEETAASAQEVTATTTQQLEAISVLSQEAEALLQEAENLEESMQRFIIEN